MEDQKSLNWALSRGRGAAYGFLSAAFRKVLEPENAKDFLESCKGGEMQHMEASFPGFLSQWEGLKELENIVSDWEGSQEEIKTRIKVEYAHLFLLPEGVHPYESIYLGNKKLLMDKPWEDVRRFYSRVGAVRGEEELHPEDHISMELGFMSFTSFLLIEMEQQEKDYLSILEQQALFLEQHLMNWTPRLKENILNNKYAQIYKPLAKMTGDLIQKDLDQIKKIINNTGASC